METDSGARQGPQMEIDISALQRLPELTTVEGLGQGQKPQCTAPSCVVTLFTIVGPPTN